jgi:hypothetical protein
MSRKMGSVAAVLAFLSLSTVGTVQARFTFHLAPAVAFQDFSRWVSSGLAGISDKDGAAIDPNGAAKHQTPRRAPGGGKQAGKGQDEAR